MNKLSVFTKMLCGLLCLHATQSSLAQTKFWGVGATTGQADAQFSNPFVQSTTAGGYSPTQWTALSVYDSDTMMPGNAYWVRNLTGVSQGGYAIGMTPMPSPSAANGVALFDSDFMDNNGVIGAFGTGSSPGIHKGELISPRIDLSAAMDSAIMIRFYSYYRRYQIDDLSASLSADDGLTWTNPESIVALQPTALNSGNSGWVRMLFPSFTIGVGNLTQCRMKFTFEGDYYYAMIDDISIEMGPEYDIAIGIADADGATYFEKGDFVRVGGNQYNTAHNLKGDDVNEWFWGAKIVNRGYKDILPSAHPRIRMQIDYIDPNSGAVTYNVYTDTIIGSSTDTLKAAEFNNVALIDYLRDIYFIDDLYSVGIYSVTYWVQHDSTDGYAINDTIRHSFEIKPNCWWWGGIEPKCSYSSKAWLSVIDGKVHGSTIFFPEGEPHNSLEYGAVFYFPNGGSYGFEIDSVEFRYHVPSGFSGDSSQIILVNIYHYEDGVWGGSPNGFLEISELTQIGIAATSLTGLGTTIPNGSSSVKTIGGFVDAAFGGPMPALVDGGFYYISVVSYPYLFGGQQTFGLNDVPVVMSDEINYAMNIGMTSSTAPILPSVMIVTDSTGSVVRTEFDKVPSIGIYTSYYWNSIDKLSTTENKNLFLYPNPTTNHLNIQTTFQEPTDVQYIITDITGKVFYIYNNKNSSNDTHIVDVAALPAGVYLVSAKTEKVVLTEKFVKK